jgi:hypothetical protein
MGRGERRPLGDLAKRVHAQVQAEIAARNLPPTTALDRVLGSHNYAFQRVKGLIALDLNDVEKIADHFGITPLELIQQALDAGEGTPSSDGLTDESVAGWISHEVLPNLHPAGVEPSSGRQEKGALHRRRAKG